MDAERTTKEELKVTGDVSVATVKQLLHEARWGGLRSRMRRGNSHRNPAHDLGSSGFCYLKSGRGRGHRGALAARLTIVIEKVEEQPPSA